MPEDFLAPVIAAAVCWPPLIAGYLVARWMLSDQLNE